MNNNNNSTATTPAIITVIIIIMIKIIPSDGTITSAMASRQHFFEGRGEGGRIFDFIYFLRNSPLATTFKTVRVHVCRFTVHVCRFTLQVC